ncbi:hypothetical protein [Sphingomonas mali]|uniref:hypothetical protein n=1 Tax=Sphingomonas mali TaxID=40682 RepID=UPI000829926B|nr:hypothetical protein [Sphingomonas mali]
MHFKMMAFVPAMLFVAPAIAQTATDAAVPAPVKEKKICRRDGPATGSILGGHVTCHTKADWNRIDSDNSRLANDAMQRSQTLQNNGQAVRQ